MRKRAILILGVALLIAAGAVVYAHWTETLYVNAQVDTGSIETHWKTVYTDDDGEPNLDDGEVVPGIWGEGSSADPSSAAGLSIGPGAPDNVLTPPTRYDKDVADCVATLDEDPHGFSLTVTNAYPSYHCTVLSTLGNQGSVPVKVQAVHTCLYYLGEPFTPPGGEPGGDYVATWETLAGHECGEQIDPGGFNTTVATIHFGELLEQTSPEPNEFVFNMWQRIELRNWNEWLEGDCSFTFNDPEICRQPDVECCTTVQADAEAWVYGECDVGTTGSPGGPVYPDLGDGSLYSEFPVEAGGRCPDNEAGTVLPRGGICVQNGAEAQEIQICPGCFNVES